MSTILHIDTSARRIDNDVQGYNSISKLLAAHFIEQWQSKKAEDKVIYRDIGLCPPDIIDNEWIAAVFTECDQLSEQQKAILALSDRLITEVDQADIILISSPMYNYGMPAALKAWFDQVIRINKTFSFDLARGDFPLAPIMTGKSLVLITSSGEFGFEVGGAREKMNHLGPHVEVLSKYIGVADFYEIGSEYQEFADARHEKSVSDAYASIEELVQKLAVNKAKLSIFKSAQVS